MQIKKIISFIPIEGKGMLLHITHIGLSFLIGIILARNLGVEMFGNYTYLVAWVILGISIVTAGFPKLLVRQIAIYKNNKEFGQIEGLIRVALFFMILVSGLFLFSVMVASFFGQLEEWSMEIVIAGMLSLFLISLSTIYESATRGLGYVLVGQLSNKVIRPVVQFLLLAFLIWGFFYESITVKTAIYIFTLSSFIGFLVAFFVLRNKRKKYGTIYLKYDFKNWYSGFWRMSFIGWMGAFNLQLSVILLGFLSSDADVAKYRVAAQIALLIPFGLTVVNTILMPSFSRVFDGGGKEELQNLVTRGCTISLVAALPILLLTLFFSEELILLLFGAGYQTAGIILFILSLGQIINVISGANGVLLLSSHKEHAVMITLGAVLILNIVLCIILIPRFGAMGAAIASAISLSLRNSYLVYFIYRNLGIISLPWFYRSK